MADPTPQEKLKTLETKAIKAMLCKLNELIKRYEVGDYHGQCALIHLEEITKLAHRVRSLLA